MSIKIWVLDKNGVRQMTKQTEALKMAIEAMDWELGGEPLPTLMIEARKACKDALEQPADGIELEWYCKGWDDAEKDLAIQEKFME